MKRKVIVFLTLVMVLGAVSVFAGSNYFSGSKRFTLTSRANGQIKIAKHVNNIKVKAKTDQGTASIKIINSSGRTVASGVNRASFRDKKKIGKYKIVVTNKTNKIQKVEVSYTASDDLYE